MESSGPYPSVAHALKKKLIPDPYTFVLNSTQLIKFMMNANVMQQSMCNQQVRCIVRISSEQDIQIVHEVAHDIGHNGYVSKNEVEKHVRWHHAESTPHKRKCIHHTESYEANTRIFVNTWNINMHCVPFCKV